MTQRKTTTHTKLINVIQQQKMRQTFKILKQNKLTHIIRLSKKDIFQKQVCCRVYIRNDKWKCTSNGTTSWK